MRVVFIGPPGSGKGTQANLLQERLGLRSYSTGDIFRAVVKKGTELGRKIAPLLAAGQLVPDAVVNDIVADLLRQPDRPERFLMDGYPRTPAQAVAFDAVLQAQKLPLRAVVSFVIPDDEAVRRLTGLHGRQRSDDDEKTVRHRLDVFRETSRELLDYYRRQGILHEVPAVDTIENIFGRIVNILQPQTV